MRAAGEQQRSRAELPQPICPATLTLRSSLLCAGAATGAGAPTAAAGSSNARTNQSCTQDSRDSQTQG